MKIELKVFSGRPNPRWFLTHEDLPDLELVILRLPHHGTAFPPLHVMGYRGFSLMNEDPSGSWTDIVVYHERITVRTRDGTNYLMDDDRTLENMLLDMARGHVNDVLIERIRSERQSAPS